MRVEYTLTERGEMLQLVINLDLVPEFSSPAK
jgi:hypothetical protein